MNIIFMNTENSKTSDTNTLLLNFTDKIDLRRKDQYVALSNLSIYYTWKDINGSHKNNKFKIAPTWKKEKIRAGEKFECHPIQFKMLWKWT